MEELLCECTWRNCHHKGLESVKAYNHGDVVTSPALCLPCLHICCADQDEEDD